MANLRKGRGGASEHQPEISDLRVLSRADLTVLAQKRPPNSIVALRDSHHRIARAVASGISNGEIVTACGISNGRIAQLRNDPAFMELVAHYRAMITSEWLKEVDPVVELLASVRTKSLAMIEAKIEDAEEKNEFLPSRDLATFAELGLDRTGYGKVNKNVNVNVDFAAALEKARARSAGARQIEAQALPGRESQSPSGGESLAPSAPRMASTLRRL